MRMRWPRPPRQGGDRRHATLPKQFRQIRIALAREPGHPEGDTDIAYIIVVPLDANLGVTPASEDSTLLSIVGRYEPPLGPLGKTLDHALLARVGDATARSFLRRMAAILQGCVEARATGEALSRTGA